MERFSSNFWHISIFFSLSLSQERITSLTANFVEFRGRDGKLLGAHYICPMQIRLKTSLSCGLRLQHTFSASSFRYRIKDNVVLLKTITAIQMMALEMMVFPAHVLIQNQLMFEFSVKSLLC